MYLVEVTRMANKEDSKNTTPVGRRARRSRKGAVDIKRSDTIKRGEQSVTAEQDDSVAGSNAFSNLGVITPEYDPELIYKVFDSSNILRPCIDAMVVNTCASGSRIVAASEHVKISSKEEKLLASVIDFINPDESLTTIKGKVVDDMERFGFGFMEVMRSDRNNQFTIARHHLARYTRLRRKSRKGVMVTREIPRGTKTLKVQESKRFRTFVQEINGERRYFKEFGDLRRMSWKTGKFEAKGEVIKPTERATELIHFRQHSDDAYGIPRWISQMPSVLGSRESEEVNLNYFENNMIPAAMLMISGGRLTESSYRDLRNTLNGQGKGSDRQNKLLLMEAVPEKDGLDDNSNVSIDLEKMQDARPSDSLFAEYDKANQDKVRGSFRLPNAIVGQSQDVTFATANVSIAVAESQVFQPMRRYMDEKLNRTLVSSEFGLNLRTVKLQSIGTTITNPESIIKTMTALGVLGGVTPREAIDKVNKDLQMNLKQYPEKGAEGYEAWMDKPTAIVHKLMAAETSENTHGESSSKSTKERETEQGGDVTTDKPEHGQE